MAKKAKEDDGESMDEGEQPKGRGRGASRGRSRGRRRLKNIPEPSSTAGSSKDKEREREVSPAESFISLPPMLQDAPEGSSLCRTVVPHNPTRLVVGSHHYSPEPYRPPQVPLWADRPPRLPSSSLPPPPINRPRERLPSPSLPPPSRTERLPSIPDLFSDIRDPRHFADPYPRRQSSPGPPPSNGGRPTRTRPRTHTYPDQLPLPPISNNLYAFQSGAPRPQPVPGPSLPPPRSMYTYASRYSPAYDRPPPPPTPPVPHYPEGQHSMLDRMHQSTSVLRDHYSDKSVDRGMARRDDHRPFG